MSRRYPNRFRGLPYINVSALRLTFLAGCLVNVVLSFLVVGVVLGLFYFSSGVSSAQKTSLIATVSPLASPTGFLLTVTPFPTITPTQTLVPVVLSPPTLIPTATPLPTYTPFPTVTPMSTATPFTLTISLALPTATPRPLYSYSELEDMVVKPTVATTYPYGFYRALCVPGVSRVEPRVIGVPDTVTGLHWKIWNHYGWSADTSEYQTSFGGGDTFFLSASPSLFYLALFFYDDQISDQVYVDYPGSCTAVQLIYLQGALPLAGNAGVGQIQAIIVISQTGEISVTTVLQDSAQP